MTEYPLDLTRTEYQLWRYILRLISHPRFSQVIEWIEFPFVPSPELRLLAHDFSFYDLKLYENTDELGSIFKVLIKNGETATLDLLEGVQLAQLDKNEQYYAKRDMLYRNTFEKLRELGYFDLIYAWLKKCHDNFDHQDVGSINTHSWLFGQWAMAAWLEDTTNRKDYTIEQEISMTEFVERNHQTRIPVQPLPFSKEQQQAIQMISLKYAYRSKIFEQIWQIFTHSSKTIWEEYAVFWGLNAYTEGSFRNSVQMMRAIVDLLSTDELLALYTSISDYKSLRTDLTSSLSDLIVPLPSIIFNRN